MNNKIPVAVLGATGTVGQKAVALLSEHPRFRIEALAASPQNAGKVYGDAVQWRESRALPSEVALLRLQHPERVRSPFVLSALPSSVAGPIESGLASQGMHVFSNASTHRMRPDVPLLIPEINSHHLSVLHEQQSLGKIVTNPNCATAFVAPALAPLRSLGTISHVSVVTMQGISGAGYPGVSAWDIMGNLLPNIAGEEEKIIEETQKILDLNVPMTVHAHRVPVLHGHTVVLHVQFAGSVQFSQEIYRDSLYRVYTDPFEPQPRRQIGDYDHKVHIGRLKHEGDRIGLIAMGHNLVRGAAGASILNMEAFVGEGACALL